MAPRPRLRDPWLGYSFAVAGVAAAAIITHLVPVLHERFTFFLYWPHLIATSWFLGAGPALVATVLSAAAVLVQTELIGTSTRVWSVPMIVAGFTVVGATTALLARWRAQAEAALLEAHRRFVTVANAAPVMIWMSGPDKQVTYFNEPWFQFTGRARERELGDGWLDGVHPEDRAACLETYARAFDERLPFRMEYRLRRADGEYRYVLDRGVPLTGEDGTFSSYIGSCIDVTDAREALQSAEAAKDAAEQASRAKDAFLATVSHELRAPLSPILTWVRMLRGKQLTEEQVDKALAVIDRNARMQAQLIEDLLDVARIVEGKLRLQVRPVALVPVIQNALETVRPAADAKDIRLQVVLDSTIADIPGDPDRLQQVVWNLLSNAVKFTPKGGRIHIVLERVNSHVELTVSDSGQGIPAEQLARLFDRFWQADSSTTRSHAGLGLGLAIVRHIVELHGGTVTADSPGPGKGSTFTVSIPVAPVTRTTEELRRHPLFSDASSVPPTRLDGIRVLVVDDEPDTNESLRVLLDACGSEVRVAGSAAHALEILSRWTPDVLVSDIGMPVEDGYALLAKIRARPDGVGRIPAIALTAFASVEDRARLLSAGFKLHVAKPADPGELTAAIAAVLAS